MILMMDDGVDYLSAAEVLEVEYKESDDETMVVWAVIHRFALDASYNHNMPMVEQRLSPEYVDSRGKLANLPKVRCPPLVSRRSALNS